MWSTNFAQSNLILIDVISAMFDISVYFEDTPTEGRQHFEKLTSHTIFLWYTFCHLSIIG